ncbi:MAG: DUF5666 domain-containing protein [Omnitrophica WOR_2 bacterium]
MSKYTHSDDPFDPEVMELVNLLRPTPPRDPQALQRGRAQYLAELDALLDDPSPQSAWVAATRGWKTWFLKSKEKDPMKRSFALSTIFALLIAALLLFGGARATAVAAQGALPGDALYPVKTGLEQTQVRLTSDAARQASLYLSFAERRLDEISGLISAGRYQEIGQASQEFERHLQDALEALQTVAVEDPSQASQLASQITTALTRYAVELSSMLSEAPAAAQPAVQQALQASQNASLQATENEIEFVDKVEAMNAQAWIIGGRTVRLDAQTELKDDIRIGDLVKVHASLDPGGELLAREIERAPAGAQPGINNEANDDNGKLDVNDDHGHDNTSDDHGTNIATPNSSGEDNSGDHHGGETRFTGIVQSTSSSVWTVAGIPLSITADTEIEGNIQPGDRVEVRAVKDANGNLVASRLRPMDDSPSNSLNSGSGDNHANDDNSAGVTQDDHNNTTITGQEDNHTGSDGASSNDSGGGSISSGSSGSGSSGDSSSSSSGDHHGGDDHDGSGSGSSGSGHGGDDHGGN